MLGGDKITNLVEEELVADPLDDDVPGVDGAGRAHQRRQQHVRHEHPASPLLRQLPAPILIPF